MSEELRDAYDLGFHRRVAPVRTAEGDQVAAIADPSQVSDPTGDVALGQMSVRKKVKDARSKMNDAIQDLQLAASNLASAFEYADSRGDDRFRSDLSNPTKMSDDDRAEYAERLKTS